MKRLKKSKILAILMITLIIFTIPMTVFAATDMRADMNSDGKVNSADAIYLLRHTIMPDRYRIKGTGDVNGDGSVNSADAIYLLRYTIMPDRYPIEIGCNHNYIDGICSICKDNVIDFSGGNGKEESPYLISTTAHLDNIRKYPNSNFKLTNDIIFNIEDFSENSCFYNNGIGWNTIESFSGCLDGDSFEIKNLYIKNAYCASFISKNLGIIKNLHIKDANINCISPVSDLPGNSMASLILENFGTIQNLKMTNANIRCISSFEDIAGRNSDSYAACLVYKNCGIIEYCHTLGYVYSENKAEGYVHSRAAGLAVFNSDNGIIRYSYNAATVVAKSICTNTQNSYAYAGGICCQNGSSTITTNTVIENCYNIGEVSGISEATYYAETYGVYVGGISALNVNFAQINCCHNVGKLMYDLNYKHNASGTREERCISGIANSNTKWFYYGGKTSNCYGDIDYEEEIMNLQNTFIGFDFQNTWIMGMIEGKIYPILKNDCKKHISVIDNAIESTCTTNGRTEGSHCSVCFAVINSPEILIAPGHVYNDDNVCTVCQIKDPVSGLVYEYDKFKQQYRVIRMDNHIDNNITIASTINNYPVTEIADSVFAWCDNIETIILPEFLISIGDQAFSNCINLTNIVIPDTVLNIGKSAFYSCKKLSSINIPQGVTIINEKTFGGCDQLTSVALSEGLITIDSYAFGWCRALRTIIIPDSVTEMKENAFYASSSLEFVVLPPMVDSLYGVFYGCYKANYYLKGETKPYINDYSYTQYYFYSDEKPLNNEKNYWHYVDGVPTPW